MANPEHPYTGPVLLVGGPHDGQVRQVDDADLVIGLSFRDAPGGLYRPNDETTEVEDAEMPVLTYERTDV